MEERLQDDEIIRQVIQGRSQAYALLVERYQHYVFTLVLRYVTDRQAAEELAQDVFVKAYRCLADFRGQSKFSTWLYTIAHTAALSHLRKKKHPTVTTDEEQMQHLSVRQGMHHPAGRESELRSEKKMLHEAITRLIPTDAAIVSLYYLQEQTLEEIGTVLGLTPNNVKVRLFRARQKLRDILETQFSSELPHL